MMCFLLFAAFTLATSSSGMLVRTCSSISLIMGKAAASAFVELFFSFNFVFSFCFSAFFSKAPRSSGALVGTGSPIGSTMGKVPAINLVEPFFPLKFFFSIFFWAFMFFLAFGLLLPKPVQKLVFAKRQVTRQADESPINSPDGIYQPFGFGLPCPAESCEEWP